MKAPRLAVLGVLAAALATPGASAARSRLPDAPFTAAPRELLDAADRFREDGDDPVVILVEDWSYGWDDEGRETWRLWRLYQVRNETALEGWSTIEAIWSPWVENPPDIRARVITPDGVEHDLDPAVLGESTVHPGQPSMFQDNRTLRGPLPAVAVGAVVEEVVTLSEHTPRFAPGTSVRLEVGHWVPIRRMTVTLSAPRGTPLRWTVRGVEGRETPLRQRGRTGVVLRFEDLAPWEHYEFNRPFGPPYFPSVEFSTAASWSDVAAGYLALLPRGDGGPAFEAAVARVREGDPDTDELVRRAFEVARDDLRYVGLEFGQQAIVPHTTTESLANAYGDCKDKAHLMQRLLEEVGVEAHLALLRTADPVAVSPEHPGLGAFDHAIVHVPSASRTWYDPTSPVRPAGELPFPDQGRLALIIAADTDGLTPIPRAPAAENLYREVRSVALPLEGPARVVETTEATGWIAATLRVDYAGVDDASIEAGLAEWVAEIYLADGVSGWSVENLDDPAGPFLITLSADDVVAAGTSSVDGAVWIRHDGLFRWLPSLLLEEDDADHPLADRDSDLDLAPHRAEIVYEISVADGYVPVGLPEDRTRRFGSATLVEEYTAREDGGVTVRLALDTGETPLSPAAAAELRDAILSFGGDDLSFVEFQQRAFALQDEGRLLEAVAEAEALAERHADDGEYRSLLAAQFLAAGLGDIARTEAERAVELSPESALAWRYLGFIRVHDRYGRYLGWPFDRAGGIVALERAAALAPQDGGSLRHLALALEVGPAGQRYGEDADLAGAIEVYREYREVTGETDLDGPLMVDLLRTQQIDALRELAESLEAGAVRDAMLLAAMAIDGDEDALRDAARRRGTPSEVLAMGAQELTLARHYEPAALLLELAARNADDAVALRQRAAVLRDLEPHEELVQELDPAVRVVVRMLDLVLRPSCPPDALRELYASAIRGDAEADSAEIAAVQRGFGALRGGLSDMPHDVWLDLITSAMEYQVDGRRESCKRVRIKSQGSSSYQTVFLVLERGAYRIRGVDSLPEVLGVEALRHVERGELDLARQWLDWADDLQDDAYASSTSHFSAFRAVRRACPDDSRACLRDAATALAARDRDSGALGDLQRLIDEDAYPGIARELRRAALSSYEARDRWEDALRTIDELLASDAHDAQLRARRGAILLELERFDEALALLAELRDERPFDPTLITLHADVVAARGDRAGALEVLRQAVEAGNTSGVVLNQAAWMMLFTGGDPSEAERLATRATGSEGSGRLSRLHTLATAHALADHPLEARDALWAAIGATGGADALGDEWFLVVGRMAESYGRVDVARAFYRQVTDRGIDLSSFELARRRLDALAP